MCNDKTLPEAKTGLYIWLDVIPFWAYVGSCSSNAYVMIFFECFESSGWCFPSFPCSPCSPWSPNLLHVLPFRMAGFHNLWSPESLITRVSNQKMTKELNYLFSSGRLQSLSGRLQHGLFLIESPILIGAIINHDIACIGWLTLKLALIAFGWL